MTDRERVRDAIQLIGRTHRPAVINVVDNSMTCACGVVSTALDGLEGHRADVILTAIGHLIVEFPTAFPIPLTDRESPSCEG
ncbi:hypothetical protein [Tessaracoccus sp.]